MSKSIDIINQKFNRWTVISRAESNKRGEAMWLCRCDCGKEKVVQGYSLRNGLSKSCGCLQKETVKKIHFEDLTGQTFGHLTALEYCGKDNSGASLWKCECSCPAKTITIARTSDLKSGKKVSCGCTRSIGEEKITQLLQEAGISFQKEKIFKECKYPDTNGYARFDFFVNNEYLIEYDGIQHFKPTFGEENFSITKSHDNYKTQWCKDNNIPLIRINYKQLDKLTIKDLIL